MKKVLIAAFTVVLFTACNQEKTAFIDNEKLIENYQEKKDMETGYEVKMEALNKKKDSIGKEFKKEVDAFQVKAKGMRQQKAQELYQQLGQKQQFLQQQFQQEQQAIAMQSQKEVDSLLSKIDVFVTEYGKTNGYTYIFGKNKAGSVLYGSDKNDITQQITDALNTAYGDKK